MLAVADARRRAEPVQRVELGIAGDARPTAPGTERPEPAGAERTAPPGAERPALARAADGGWTLAGRWPAPGENDLAAMLALYQPLLAVAPGHRFIVGHLGQSLDGRIATRTGDSQFISGPDNLVHLHRLRALCDAVLVGARTVACDDPRLTTRHVRGPNPRRIVIDPSARVEPGHRICQDDAAPTLLLRTAGDTADTGPASRCGQAQVLAIRPGADGVDLPGLLAQLADHGVHTLLIEGGGITVSRFLAAGLLDRLHLAIAPLIIGSGRQGLQLPAVDRLGDGLRPQARVHRMGADMLWDLDLAAGRAG